MHQTLVTSVTTHHDPKPFQPLRASAKDMRDVLTLIYDLGATHVISFVGRDRTIEVTLTGAERIALIEGLGGKP